MEMWWYASDIPGVSIDVPVKNRGRANPCSSNRAWRHLTPSTELSEQYQYAFDFCIQDMYFCCVRAKTQTSSPVL